MFNTILSSFNIEDYAIWFWLAVFVITIAVEAMTQDLVSIWFTLGSLVSLCISYLAPWWVQLIVFVVVSTASLIATRPLVKKLMRSQIRKTNTDEFIGQRTKLLSDVSKFEMGTLKLNSVIYSVVLPEEEDEEIKKDTVVEIVTIKGNKLVVRKVEE